MKKKSLAINALLNGIKSIMSVLFPLITFPYVSKILQVENLGKYNFAQSVCSYFLLIASMGIATYAVREGARYRENKKKMSIFASEVFSINIVSMIFSYILLALTVTIVPQLHSYAILIFIFGIEIFFQTIGTEWLYSIYEEYSYITLRSIIFQMVSLILLFGFVKEKEDYYIYAIITVIADAGSNISNALHRKNICKIKAVWPRNWKAHIKPILIIFAANIATTIYVNTDSTMLGFMTTDYNVGLYAVAVKIYKVVKTLLSAILVVSIPRLSNYLGNNEKDKYEQTFAKIFNALLTIAIPAVLGLFLLSEQVVLVLSDSTYIEATNSLRILSLALFVCIFGWLYNSCVLIPQKKEKQALIATVASAMINFGLNFFLIPVWKQDAAAFTTLVAETCSMVMCVYYSKGLVKLKLSIRDIASIVVGSCCVAGVCIGLKFIVQATLLYTFLSIGISIAVYGIVLIVMRNSFIYEGLEILKNKFHGYK